MNIKTICLYIASFALLHGCSSFQQSHTVEQLRIRLNSGKEHPMDVFAGVESPSTPQDQQRQIREFLTAQEPGLKLAGMDFKQVVGGTLVRIVSHEGDYEAVYVVQHPRQFQIEDVDAMEVTRFIVLAR